MRTTRSQSLLLLLQLLLLLLLLLMLWTYESSNTSGEKSSYFLQSPATAEANSENKGFVVCFAGATAPVREKSHAAGSWMGSCSRSLMLEGPQCGAMLPPIGTREKKAWPKEQSHSGRERKSDMVAGHDAQFAATNSPPSCDGELQRV
jgi:hypothetical protein